MKAFLKFIIVFVSLYIFLSCNKTDYTNYNKHAALGVIEMKFKGETESGILLDETIEFKYDNYNSSYYYSNNNQTQLRIYLFTETEPFSKVFFRITYNEDTDSLSNIDFYFTLNKKLNNNSYLVYNDSRLTGDISDFSFNNGNFIASFKYINEYFPYMEDGYKMNISGTIDVKVPELTTEYY